MRTRCRIGLAAACAVAAFTGSPAQPQSRLPLAEVQPMPRDGLYMAGEYIPFVIDHFANWTRLRFPGHDEVFYLSSEAAPLGARVFKYDTGDPALRVTGWGGVTLYSPPESNGIPAEFSDPAEKLETPAVPTGDVRRFAVELVKEVDSRSDSAIGFAADWDQLQRSDALKELACDAMRNASYALEAAASGPARNAVADGIHVVRIVQGDHVAAAVRRGVLTITIAPKLGPAARPSSLQISRAIAAAFTRPVRE